MSWRDFIVTSSPLLPGSQTPAKGNIEDFEDIALNKTKKNSSSYREDKSQIHNPMEGSSISPKPPDLVSSCSEVTDRLSVDVADKHETPTSSPTPPLQAGWLIAYRDQHGRLRGGCDERDAGTVAACRWDGSGWRLLLTNGETLALGQIVSVTMSDAEGRVLEAWTVRRHGYDGQGPLA